MNQWNQLEKQLRSWSPRTPSSKLKERLFDMAGVAEPAEGVRAESRGWAAQGTPWGWLAPAMAVFMLGMFLYGNQAGLLHHFQSASASLLATASLTQPEFSTYYASVQHSENNTLRNTFEWTNANGNSSLSTAPPMAKTNSVMH